MKHFPYNARIKYSIHLARGLARPYTRHELQRYIWQQEQYRVKDRSLALLEWELRVPLPWEAGIEDLWLEEDEIPDFHDLLREAIY